MNSVIVGATFLLVVVVSSAFGWPYEDEYSAWKLARSSRRSHSCVSSGGKCFSTTQCCRGFVCAAFDDYFGERRRAEGTNPEIPGLCVKEKDLQPCYSSRECDSSAKCVTLGRNGETYCVGRDDEVQVAQASNGIKSGSGTGRVGSLCQHSSDCRPYEKDGSALCCQKVKLGRQGKKVMCDRVTELSDCLN